jgi:PHP family Zn ribbon phosphoesterase
MKVCRNCNTEFSDKREISQCPKCKAISIHPIKKGKKFLASVAEISSTGIKHDDSKPALQYIPKAAMFAMGDAFAHGAKKYGPFNYRGGLAVTRTLAAAVRHITNF